MKVELSLAIWTKSAKQGLKQRGRKLNRITSFSCRKAAPDTGQPTQHLPSSQYHIRWFGVQHSKKFCTHFFSVQFLFSKTDSHWYKASNELTSSQEKKVNTRKVSKWCDIMVISHTNNDRFSEQKWNSSRYFRTTHVLFEKENEML